MRGLYEYCWKDFFKDCYDYCRIHSIKEIAAAVWKSGCRYYSENPLDLATLVISLISLGVSSVVIVIAILSPR